MKSEVKFCVRFELLEPGCAVGFLLHRGFKLESFVSRVKRVFR